jgi:hypothetical protein
LEEKIKSIKITLFVPKTGFKGMTVNNSVVVINGLRLEHLHISQNAGRIWMSNSEIGKIQMNALSKSYFDISATRLDTLSAALQESQLHLSNSPVKLVEGSMKQHSVLRLSDIEEIQFKKDESSRLNSYE